MTIKLVINYKLYCNN